MNQLHILSKLKQAKTCILTAALIAISSMPSASGQTQHWRTAAREKSQRMASSAQNQLVLSKADEAIPLLQEGTRADPTDPLPFLLLGMALNMKGRYQEALDALKQSYALDSKARETYLTVGFSHYLSHRYEQAIGVWQKVLQANPDVVPIYTNIGFALLRDGKLEEAENSLRECAKRSTYSGASYRGLMLLHYLNGNFPIARSAAQQAGPAGGKQAHLILAEMDFLEGNAKQAAKQIASVPKPSKKSRPSFDMVSIGYLPQHDFHFDPFSTDYFDNESLIEARFVDLPKRESRRSQLSKKGKSDSALSDVRTALSSAPNDPYLNFQSGSIRLAAGDFPAASQDFAKVIGRAPDWHLAKLYLALSRFREGKVADAKAALEGFERACPGRQLAPLFALIKNADNQPGQTAATEQKDEQFSLPDDAKNRPPSKGDAGF